MWNGIQKIKQFINKFRSTRPMPTPSPAVGEVIPPASPTVQYITIKAPLVCIGYLPPQIRSRLVTRDFARSIGLNEKQTESVINQIESFREN